MNPCKQCDWQIVEAAADSIRWCGRCGSLEIKMASGHWEIVRPSHAPEQEKQHGRD